MESLLDYKISKGVRYVLGCKTSEGYAYFNPLDTQLKNLDDKAFKLLRQMPALHGKLHLLELKAMDTVLPGKVMVLSSDPKYFGLQRVYETSGDARNSLENSHLTDKLKISSFIEEVVKIYES